MSGLSVRATHNGVLVGNRFHTRDQALKLYAELGGVLGVGDGAKVEAPPTVGRCVHCGRVDQTLDRGGWCKRCEGWSLYYEAFPEQAPNWPAASPPPLDSPPPADTYDDDMRDALDRIAEQQGETP